MSLSNVRAQLGWTQSFLAMVTGLSERTIRRIERNLHVPRAITQYTLLRLVAHHPTANSGVGIRVITVNRLQMAKYLYGPAKGWQRWPGWKRAAWRRWKNYYQRIQRDAQAGLCVIEGRWRPTRYAQQNAERRDRYQRWLKSHHFPV